MLSEADRAIINETVNKTAWAVGEKIAARIEENTRLMFKLHAAECPVKAKVEAQENKFLGGWRTLAALAAVIMALAGLAIHFVK
jgi:anti-sigma-K factor RskA